MAEVSVQAPKPIHEYYSILTGGSGAGTESGALAAILDEQMVFEGPVAGRRVGSAPFLRGVAGFIDTVQRIEVVQDVHAPQGSAVLYDAHMPGGVVRFSEFFTVSDGLIRTLRLHFDPSDYAAKGGR